MEESAVWRRPHIVLASVRVILKRLVIMNISVIIVAGGRGSRMKSELPKQFLPLAGRPVLMHTVERFYEALPEARLIVVLPGDLLG